MKTYFTLLLAGSLLLSCSTSQRSATDKAAAEQAMQAVYDTFSKAYLQADPAMVAGLYTEDAYYLQPNNMIMQGRDSIQATFASFLNRFQPGNGPDISFEIIDRRISGQQAYDIGYYLFNGARSGKFIVLWQKEDGEWRIRADGFSGLE